MVGDITGMILGLLNSASLSLAQDMASSRQGDAFCRRGCRVLKADRPRGPVVVRSGSCVCVTCSPVALSAETEESPAVTWNNLKI